MLAIVDFLILSTGWTRRVVAFTAGAFGALALAPLNIAPALIITMVVAVLLIDGAAAQSTRREGIRQSRSKLWRSLFGAGWWLGFGYFVAGFWWLGAAFLIDPHFTWALPLGVIGVPAILALTTGFGFIVAGALWVPNCLRVLALAVGLSVSEWCRGHLFTGFPWNNFGMGLGGNLLTAQTASLVGLDGLTFLTVALCAAPATLTDTSSRLGRWLPTAIAVASLALISSYGWVQLMETVRQAPGAPLIRIVQPGLRPDAEFTPENKDRIVSHYIDLSEQDDKAKGVKLNQIAMLVWPESAFPFILTRDADELSRIGQMLPVQTLLVTGAAREDDIPATRSRKAHSVYFNAIQVIAPGGAVIDSYDKVHLVPFGEYLPFSGLLRRLGLRNFVDVPGGFDPGMTRRLLDVPPGARAAPLICYEAIFPQEIIPAAGVNGRPTYLLNITNDGWFGLTSGPWQHYAQARLRSIEQGLPMVRGAATGISAVFDSHGRPIAMLPLGVEGIIDEALPPPGRITIFARYGQDLFLLVCSATTALLLAAKLTISRGRPL